ncbi:response regulator [Egibacter rhizosphaerae]|uniref:Response regulator n=1 Tax=Egibacter rhizosphaerae TaxID=1670831 RepID=A0A411YJ54_9ACTN|nr:response regulator [Egibacter rhizosphaerae]QBI21260.1 response regulator [Egibacter rhizosphaerae]
MKILIVDDSKAMRKIVQRALQSTQAYGGAALVEATNGREALDVVESEQPDIVLSDWNMPEMTGIELLEVLKERGAAPKTFGFVTSESTPEMYDRAISAGAGFLVSKPFTAEALESALAAA